MSCSLALVDFDGTLADSMPYWLRLPVDTLREANLPQPETETVFAGASTDESAIPVWAQSAAAALRQAGIAFPADCADEPVTRLAGAQLLFAACQKNA